jgi:hypothetical protein
MSSKERKIASAILCLVAAGLALFALGTPLWSQTEPLDLTQVTIAPPCPAIPFYHLRGRISPPPGAPLKIFGVTANGVRLNTFEIRDLREPLVLDKPYRFTWPLFAGPKVDEFVFQNPWIIARLDWRDSERYEVVLELGVGPEKRKQVIAKSIVAPSSGGFWNAGWKYYKSIVVSEDFGLDRTDEPVEGTLLFYPDQFTDLNRELRVVRVGAQGETEVVPCQISSVSQYLKPDSPRTDPAGRQRPFYWLPTVAAQVVIPVSIKARTSQVLLAFYGNPKAEPPAFKTDLSTAGKDLALTVENSYFRAKLHHQSGMIDELALRSRPQEVLKHGLETNGAIHWNPDAYSPPRPWMHASDWNPPEEISVVRGPVTVITHRKGIMPNMPEIKLGITYKFFARQPYLLMTSSLEIAKDVPLQALRNGEMVLDHKLIDQASWRDPALADVQIIRLESVPLLTEIRLPLDTEWLSFYNSRTRVGLGGVPLEDSVSSPGLEPATYNPYLYLTQGPWVYWTRVLAAPYLTSNIQQIMSVPAGSYYWEKWAYVPFELGRDPQPFRQLDDLTQRLSHPLRLTVIDERDARVRIPDEIYTDATKTGWKKEETK